MASDSRQQCTPLSISHDCNVLHAAWENLELGRAIRDPCFLHSFAVPGSESPANTTVSLLHTITLSPKFYVEISITFLKHP